MGAENNQGTTFQCRSQRGASVKPITTALFRKRLPRDR